MACASCPASGVDTTPRLSSVLSAPTSTAETRRVPASRTISPDGMDLRPRRPAGRDYRDGIGCPGREVLAAERGVEGRQGEQKIRRGAGSGHRLGKGRALAPHRARPRGPAGATSSGSGTATIRRASCTLTGRTPGSLAPQRGPPRGRRRQGRPRRPACPAARRTRPVTPGTEPQPAGHPRGRRPGRRRPGGWPAPLCPDARRSAWTFAFRAASSPCLPGRQRLRRTAPTLSLTGAPRARATSSRRYSRSDMSARITTKPRPRNSPPTSPMAA